MNTTDLLHRNSGGVDITLLWHHGTASLTLDLVDHLCNRVTQFDVPPERASYAFNHPYAYGYQRQLAA